MNPSAPFLIERRAPGHAVTAQVPWETVATVTAPHALAAIHAFCAHHGWESVGIDHNVATVPGLGRFRASVAPDSPLAHVISIQFQDPIGPDDLHTTWSQVATLAASDAESAIRAYADWMGWSGSDTFGHVLNVVGIGSFRAMPM